jgi:methyl-accepting chemotaxis protein
MAWTLLDRFGRRRARAVRGWASWLNLLDAARVELAELNQATESDFLHIGEKLQGFLDVSGRISDQCARLVAVLSGEETERASQDLCSILERARDMAEQAARNRMALDHMLEDVGCVARPLLDLNAKMRSFRVMATLIRIEGSRLKQAGVDFETLAEDVRKLASDIEENGKTVLASSIELRQIVAQAGSGIAEFEARQRAELPRIRQQAESGLAALRERRSRAGAATNDMAGRYDSIQREICGLVTSLQFHDITRQQVEHAAVALEQTRELSAGETDLLVRICRLQSAQLEHARHVFLAAVQQARESLAAVARNVLKTAEEAAAVTAGEQEDTFLGEMEQGFAGIRNALAECAESRYSLSTVADAVAGGVQEMSGYVAAIEEIGIRMQRIALNANIKAIRIGDQGSALGAVADAIQRLAAESTGQTEIVSQGIRAVAEGSDRLSTHLMESGADLTAALEHVITAFHAADDENRERLAAIGSSGKSFSEELDALSAGIRADGVMAAVTERSCARLEEVIAAAEPLMTGGGADSDEVVRGLESQYTMHAERAVHQHAAGEPVMAEVSAPEAAAADELGTNVELF